ncbi:serine hydrolase domain-containing protein [Actinoplanes sp. NEAU-A12]|uniref:Serine hydrolase domain-containing protein n=1 Tax=Actinoplanes sandaracinus TaxID=3045177 RepID=A0ABT6WVJ0_9ACTN|nr:serine hydrolase domain-containing protein [Actinoplanes sandaracinus]MDI6103763.1 serine hydrolase domain-containing protein [Actinoplanes sandaracinus]
MRKRTRTTAALAVTAVVTAALGVPSAVAAHPARCVLEPSVPTTLPTLSATKLSAAIGDVPGGLPDAEASGALAQIRGTAGCWQGTAGIGDIRTGGDVPQNGKFRIGSMTKVFTAVVALQLVAEGRLDLDKTVQEYLPGFLPADYLPITVRQVLNYTSGLNGVGVPHKTPAWFFEHRYDHWADGSQLDVTKPLAFAPGEYQRYGNADYWMAGLLIQKVTGHAWEREVHDRIIEPLRLRGTSTPVDSSRIPGPYSHGYEVTKDGWVDVSSANPSLQWSAAAIISTPEDLDRFMVALFDGKLVPPAQLDLMFTVPPGTTTFDGDKDPANNPPAAYGMGLGSFQIGSLTVWGKTGDRPGYANGMGATRDLSRRLVFSVNTLHMGGDQPVRARQIIGAAFS